MKLTEKNQSNSKSQCRASPSTMKIHRHRWCSTLWSYQLYPRLPLLPLEEDEPGRHMPAVSLQFFSSGPFQIERPLKKAKLHFSHSLAPQCRGSILLFRAKGPSHNSLPLPSGSTIQTLHSSSWRVPPLSKKIWLRFPTRKWYSMVKEGYNLHVFKLYVLQ